MSTIVSCRVCLCRDRRTYDIIDTVLLQVWEKLMNIKFSANDGKSFPVCYLCYEQLRKSHQLMNKAVKAGILWTVFTNNGLEQSPKAISMISSLTRDFDYNYVPELLENIECVNFTRYNQRSIKKDIGEEHEKENKIKEEPEDCLDSLMEEKTDSDDVASGPISDDETSFKGINLKKILQREVRIVLEKVDVGSLLRKRKLNDVPQKSKLIKFKETAKGRKYITPRNKKTHNFKVNQSNAQNESFKHSLQKNANAIASSASLDSSEGGNRSNILNTGSKKYFSCHICHYKSVSQFNLNSHLRKHTGEKPYVCEFCDYRFSHKCALTRHIKCLHTKEKNFSCEICEYRSVAKAELIIHLRKHTGEKPYVCGLCDYRCSYKSSLKPHMQFKHTKEKNFSCHICQYKCVTKYHLDNHLRKHTGEKPYVCDLCNYRCSHKSSLTTHMQFKHTKEKNFSCHLCQYKCVTKSHLKNHLRKHTGEKPYVCVLCEFRSTEKTSLQRHMQYKHTNERNFSCHMCHYKFVTKGHLNSHLRTHTREKPHTCNLCDFRCSNKSNLKKHVKYKHTKEKDFSCHICQYKCVIKPHLNRHLRKHTGEKPYICDLCDYRSSSKDGLIAHMQFKHINDRNFSCHICQNKFVTKAHLNRHLRTHTRTKPYLCELCVFRCSQKKYLNRHMQNVHIKN